MKKNKYLFQKIRDNKGAFLTQMDKIKDRNSMDQTKAEHIKQRWQEFTEELYKNDLKDLENHSGVFTHLEPNIYECEVKQSLKNILTKKLMEVMEFQLSQFNS